MSSMLIRQLSTTALLLLGFSLPFTTVNACAHSMEHTTRSAWLQLAEAPSKITKGQAARAAQNKHGGKVLSVSQAGSNYRVKLLKDSGKVVIVIVDGQSGKVR